jgi:hypothetical protein
MAQNKFLCHSLLTFTFNYGTMIPRWYASVKREMNKRGVLLMEQLDEFARAERREYHREWRKRNPDKVKEQNAAYWRRRAERKLRETAQQEGGQGDEHHQ